MGKNTFLNATLVILLVVVVLALLVMVLVGENGLINREIKKYKDTHVEETMDTEDNDNIVYVN